MSVSVLILTLNEEINLPGCLESVAWSDDIVVFDSFSTDRTVEIAQAAGARVIQRKFDNYAAQRNAALTEVAYRHPWVLMVDADERWPVHIFEEIKVCIGQGNGEVSLAHFRRKDMFLGKWLRRSTGYPTWSGRLVRAGHVSVERDINEEYHTDGKKAYLKSHFIHYPFNKGIAHWFDKHNRYSSMEAETLVKEMQGALALRQLFSSDPTVRRKCLKQLAYRLPCRPFLVFCYLYFFRMGFLDGSPGLTYCRLRAIYEYMIDLKVKELRRREQRLPM
jgi:glycosyltransferase involved in cell wall biosynthesis